MIVPSITSINNNIGSINRISANNNKRNHNNSENFTGMTDAMVNFWHCIDKGGRAAQFTVEDMSGTNIPRSIKGAFSGFKYTRKINWNALKQEGLREFLTGPTMCLTPYFVLKFAKHSQGESANTHIENMKNLSYILENTLGSAESKEVTKEEFYSAAIKDMLQKSAGVADDGDVKKMTSAFVEYKNATDILHNKKKIKEFGGKKAVKTKVASALDNVRDLYEGIIKHRKPDYNGVDFMTAKYSVGKNVADGETNFKNYIGYIGAYADDYAKKHGSNGNLLVSKDKIKQFRNSWMGKRAVVIVSMIAITAALMSYIPKLYTLASGKTNPNGAAIYDVAKEQNGQATDKNQKDNSKEVK